MKIYRNKQSWLVGYVDGTGTLRFVASFPRVWQARAYVAAVS